MKSAPPDAPQPGPPLLPLQERAVARLVYAIEQPGTLAVLCGPPGTGKSLVLEAAARAAQAAGRSCAVVSWHDAEALTPDAWPEGLLLDDADAADEGTLAAFIGKCRSAHPRTSVIVAGSGRLLTLIARDRRLERAVRFRAILGPCSRGETRALATRVLRSGMPAEAPAMEVVDAIHEIGGGIPSDVVHLAELAALVAADDRSHPLTADAIERIHARLAVTAA